MACPSGRAISPPLDQCDSPRDGGGRESREGRPHAGVHEIDDALLRRQHAPSHGDQRASLQRHGPELRRMARHDPAAVARGSLPRRASLYLLRLKKHRDCLNLDAMPMLEELIVTGAWWDFVDEVARVVGDLLLEHPKQMKPLMRR